MWTPGLTYQVAELCVFLKEKGCRNFQLLENLDQLLSPYIIVDRKRRTVVRRLGLALAEMMKVSNDVALIKPLVAV